MVSSDDVDMAVFAVRGLSGGNGTGSERPVTEGALPLWMIKELACN